MTTLSGVRHVINERDLDSARATGGARYDTSILCLVGVLMTLGAVMVYSASVSIQGAPLDLRNWWNTPLRQCVFAVGGLLMMLLTAHLDYRIWAWERPGDGWWSGALYAIAVGLLVAVFVPGIGAERLGAQRAIVVLNSPISVSFQPSEWAKVVLVIWIAALLTRPNAEPASLTRGFLPALLTGGLLIALTGIEDFGTAALMGAVLFLLLIWLRGNPLHLLGLVLLGGAGGAGLVWMKPYRWERIRTFFTEAPDPLGDGYQITQSLIAIGSGGWWGRGLGAGIQKYGYLPQDNNDFIFAVLCEELGIVGGVGVVLLFLLLLWRGARLAARCRDPFGKAVAAGITLTFCLQAAFNIAVVTDSVPTKGISLPFVSAGGSGVIFLGMAAGVLASIERGCGGPKVRPRRIGE